MQISVVIPTYNRYGLLKRAVHSVFSQTYPPTEVIVIDDGSDDATSQIQQDFSTLKYIFQSNKGVSSARNLGIINASSDWIAFLDSDDEWHKNKLQKQVNFHKQNQNILMSYTDEEWIRDSKIVKIPKKFQKFGLDIFAENLSYCNIAPSSVVMHQKLLKKVGFFDENLEVCEDYDLWLRIAHNEKIGLVNEKLIRKYAGHEDQLSFKYWGMDRFRVLSLEKLLCNEEKINDAKHQDIENELLKKYTLLLKGAIKHEREEDIKNYEQKLAKF